MLRRIAQRIRHIRTCRANGRWLAQVCADDDRRAEDRVIDLVALEQQQALRTPEMTSWTP